jgi:hypothetical protein
LHLTRSRLRLQLGDRRIAQAAGMTTPARALAKHVVAPPFRSHATPSGTVRK